MPTVSGLLIACSCALWLIGGVETRAAAEEGRQENGSLSTVAAMPSTTTVATVGQIKCGDTDQVASTCFRDLPPHLVEFLKSSKVISSDEDIASKCTIFHRGMACFDEYTDRCLNADMANIYRGNVEGARTFFREFCNNSDFQEGYLRHKDCFAYIEGDWARCTQSFQTILANELYAAGAEPVGKFIAFCCARKAYENCIHNSARAKCFKHSAEFARETAKMLSDERHFINCRQYESIFCQRNDIKLRNGGNALREGRISAIQLLMILMLWDMMLSS